MMTIQQIVEAFEEKGFKVHKFWNQCTPSEQGYYEFTIIKDDTYVGGRYEWRPELSPDVITLYQRNFIDELLERWKKEHDRYCREMLAKGLTEGITNLDPESKQYAKQILNSIYGAASPLTWEHKGEPIGRVIADTDGLTIHMNNSDFAKAFVKYCEEDVKNTKELWTKMNPYINNPKIKDVIFNDPATIVFWSDGTKTVVKCQEYDIYDPEKGLAMAISKKFLGNKGNYCNEIKKWMDKYIEKIGEEINPFQIAWDKACETVKQAKLTIPKIDLNSVVPAGSITPTTDVSKPVDGPKTIKMLATMEIEVDVSNLVNTIYPVQSYSDVIDAAKDIARNRLRDLMLNKDINADSFNYEMVITNKE